MNRTKFCFVLLLAVNHPLIGEVPFFTLWSREEPQALTVTEDPEISAVCALRARELQQDGQLSHLDDRGLRVGSQMVSLRFQEGEWGEILGAGANLESIFQAWMSSPTHRELLKTPRWRSFGWGEVRENNVSVVVVRFWRP